MSQISFNCVLNKKRETAEYFKENEYFKAQMIVSHNKRVLSNCVDFSFYNDNVKTIRKFLEYETSVMLNKQDTIKLIEFLQEKVNDMNSVDIEIE